MKEALQKIYAYAESLGLKVINSDTLDPYFKGDLNGVEIWISKSLSEEEQMFNIVHLLGHSVQWNVSKKLRFLGSVLHEHPSDHLLRKLQDYEHEANCYGLYALHQIGIMYLDEWLEREYTQDMLYLTHFYKTGEKLKEVTAVAKLYRFDTRLIPKKIPVFEPYASLEARNGIVI